MNAEDIAAVARVIELVKDNPPKDEYWDMAERHQKALHKQLRDWLKEKL